MELHYIVTYESWYFPVFYRSDCTHEIMVMINPDPDGSIAAEFGIRWYQLGSKIYPRIELFGDCWKFLPELQPLFSELSTLSETATKESVIECLKRMNAVDVTERRRD